MEVSRRNVGRTEEQWFDGRNIWIWSSHKGLSQSLCQLDTCQIMARSHNTKVAIPLVQSRENGCKIENGGYKGYGEKPKKFARVEREGLALQSLEMVE
jgi:hypothetical protein